MVDDATIATFAKAWAKALGERRYAAATQALDALYTAAGDGAMHTNLRRAMEMDRDLADLRTVAAWAAPMLVIVDAARALPTWASDTVVYAHIETMRLACSIDVPADVRAALARAKGGA